eukprot:RCo034787
MEVIVPLTAETLDRAIALLCSVFPYSEFLPPFRPHSEMIKEELTRCIYPEKYPPTEESPETDIEYWTVMDPSSGKVLGVCGLYKMPEDYDEAVWGGWLGVDPNCRGTGIGHRIVHHVLEKAKQKGVSFVRVYSSNHSNEAIANAMYRQIGAKLLADRTVVSSVFETPNSPEPLKLIFYELPVYKGEPAAENAKAGSRVGRSLDH